MKRRDDTPLDEGDEGFLSRWSRRKQAVAAGQPPEPAVPAPAAEAPEAEAEPLLTDADMPPLDALDEQSDYSGFLSPGVSEELRQLALRKLFRAATFNVTDGLDDYDEDFTSFAKLGEIVTREMRVRDAIDEAREKAKALLEQEPAGQSLPAQAEPEAAAEDDEPHDAQPQMPRPAGTGPAAEPTEEIDHEQ